MSWTLTTAEDERARCCVIRANGNRCEQPSMYRIEGRPYAWDDYTYTCSDDAEMVLRAHPGSVAILVEDESVARQR